MLCYKDRTYCEFEDCKNFGPACNRSLTKKVHQAAEKWWGNPNPPIAVFLDKPECYRKE